MERLKLFELKRLVYEDCMKYKSQLVSFYYKNSKSCSHLGHFSKVDAEKKIDSMAAHIQEGTAIVFGIISEDKLIGYVWSYEHTFREETRIYVSEIHVEESYRGNGIGKMLLRAVEKVARENGYPALYIHTEGDNKGAIRLYENEGYVLERVQLRKQL